MNKKLVLVVLILLVTLILATCAPRVMATFLPPEEGAAYAAEVDEIVENMIIGDSACDYAMFTHDLSPKSQGIPDESAWQQKCEANRGVYGTYLSKTLDHVEDRGKVRVVIYYVVFANDPDITLEVKFQRDDPDHIIIGIIWQVE
jgi:hypothetical protein